MDSRKIAITHCSGLLAQAIIEKMIESGFTSDSIVLLDTQSGAGTRQPFADSHITVLDQNGYDYEGLLAVLLVEADAELADLLQHADCFVISHFFEEGIAPVLPVDAVIDKPTAIKLPDPVLSNLLAIIKPIHDLYECVVLNVVTVESVSVYGKAATEELASQTVGLLNSQPIKNEVFPQQIAFNMLPDIDRSNIPQQMVKMLKSPELSCCVQSITVPAFHGFTHSIYIETNDKVGLVKLEKQLEALPGVELKSELITPVSHCKSGSKAFITGLHQPQNSTNRVQFWLVTDSIKNSLLKNYLNLMDILLKFHL